MLGLLFARGAHLWQSSRNAQNAASWPRRTSHHHHPLHSSSNDVALITCLLQNETVINIANKHSKSPAQVLLAWGLQHQTSVIPRATQLSQQKVLPATSACSPAGNPCRCCVHDSCPCLQALVAVCMV